MKLTLFFADIQQQGKGLGIQERAQGWAAVFEVGDVGDVGHVFCVDGQATGCPVRKESACGEGTPPRVLGGPGHT